MLAKSFPRKQVYSKYFHQKNFGPHLIIVAKSFPRKQVYTKYFGKKNFGRKQFSSKNVWSRIFMGKFFVDEIHSKTFRLKNLNNSWSKICMVGISFPPKQSSSKHFWSKIFYCCKIISSKTGLNQKFSLKLFW